MASKRPSRLPILPITSPESFQISRSKGNSNDELIDFLRKASLRSNVVLDHDFATRLPRRNTPFVNYDIDFDSESYDNEEARVLQGDEKNSDLETLKKRIHKDNLKKKVQPYHYYYMISRKTSQSGKQESLKANVPSYRWLDTKYNEVLTSSATKDVTRPRANTFPSESTRLSSLPIETTTTRYATDEIFDNQSISGGNTSVKVIPNIWNGKTPPISSKTSMQQQTGGADEIRVVLNTQGATELHHGGTRQNNQDERSNKRSSKASLLSLQGKAFAENTQSEVNLQDSDKITERNIKKKISKVPFLKKKVSPKGKGSFLDHSPPKARLLDLQVVSRSSSESKQANNTVTLNRGPVHKSTHKKDLSQTVKEFVGKPQPRASWPILRVSKGTASHDLQFSCGKQKTYKVHPSETGQRPGVPINTDTCPSMSKFTDRKWYYQDKTGRCRYLREPVSRTPSVSHVFMKESEWDTSPSS